MFVTQKKYDDMVAERDHWKRAADECAVQLQMVRGYLQVTLSHLRIVRARLDSGVTVVEGPQLDPDDIDRLIRLCHPDKHAGSVAATVMTQKLLSMRGVAK